MEAAGRLARQAEAYAADKVSGPSDLLLSCGVERVMQRNGWIPDRDTAEYMGTGALFAQRLVHFNGFQLHASAVVAEERAWLFSGPSGIGKSTLTKRWTRLFGAVYLNDDKPALRRTEDQWRAWGTPWSGKHDLSAPASAPVGGVVFLRQGGQPRMERLPPYDALPLMMSQTPHALTADGMSRLLELMDGFLREVPVWRLICRNDDAGALLAHRLLLEENKT
ncbi:MAG: hypothetical protein Q4C72_03270 [Eubacteriales bacterium]|nr:hypothetical protein [Eubacteriales bacterium]